MKKRNKYSRRTESFKHQEILIVGSIAMEILELLGTILHIASLSLGIITITELIIVHGEINTLEKVLEITTLVIISLLVIQYITSPIIRRILLKWKLRDIWGEIEINSKLKIVKDSKFTDFLSEISQIEEKFHKTKLVTGWKRTHKFMGKKIFEINLEFLNLENLNTKNDSIKVVRTFNPKYIIIDVRTNELKFHSSLKSNDVVFKNKKDFIFTFYSGKQHASWSGVYPENPIYGEWNWGIEESNDAKIE